MKKLANNIWIHRRVAILKDAQGIWCENSLHLFKTLTDACAYIDKTLDGTNKREPRIVGEWDYKKAGY